MYQIQKKAQVEVYMKDNRCHRAHALGSRNLRAPAVPPGLSGGDAGLSCALRVCAGDYADGACDLGVRRQRPMGVHPDSQSDHASKPPPPAHIGEVLPAPKE